MFNTQNFDVSAMYLDPSKNVVFDFCKSRKEKVDQKTIVGTQLLILFKMFYLFRLPKVKMNVCSVIDMGREFI